MSDRCVACNQEYDAELEVMCIECRASESKGLYIEIALLQDELDEAYNNTSLGKLFTIEREMNTDLKDEVKRLTAKKSECKIIKGPEHTWHSGMCIYCGIFKVEVDDEAD